MKISLLFIHFILAAQRNSTQIRKVMDLKIEEFDTFKEVSFLAEKKKYKRLFIEIGIFY